MAFIVFPCICTCKYTQKYLNNKTLTRIQQPLISGWPQHSKDGFEYKSISRNFNKYEFSKDTLHKFYIHGLGFPIVIQAEEDTSFSILPVDTIISTSICYKYSEEINDMYRHTRWTFVFNPEDCLFVEQYSIAINPKTKENYHTKIVRIRNVEQKYFNEMWNRSVWKENFSWDGNLLLLIKEVKIRFW